MESNGSRNVLGALAPIDETAFHAPDRRGCTEPAGEKFRDTLLARLVLYHEMTRKAFRAARRLRSRPRAVYGQFDLFAVYFRPDVGPNVPARELFRLNDLSR
jgi:hypothetical protein